MDDPSSDRRSPNPTFRFASESNSACIDFLRDLVTLPSPSRGERLACERVVREMEQLGYGTSTSTASETSSAGSAPAQDARSRRPHRHRRHQQPDALAPRSFPRRRLRWNHVRTRRVRSEGRTCRGRSRGRPGRPAGLPADATVWVTATVNGEDCVGQAWQYILNESSLAPRGRGHRHAVTPRCLSRPTRTHGAGNHASRRLHPRIAARSGDQRHLRHDVHRGRGREAARFPLDQPSRPRPGIAAVTSIPLDRRP